MDFKERYIRTITYKNPDRVPLMPGKPREVTLSAWYNQGFPEGMDYFDALLSELGLGAEAKPNEIKLNVSTKVIPEFEEKILEHRDGHYIVQDYMGAIVEMSDEYDCSWLRTSRGFVTRKWHSFPVKNREDWQEMKKRFDPDSPGRVPEDINDLIDMKNIKSEFGDPLLKFAFNGPFWQLRNWLGFEELCIKFIEDPEFIEEMIEFWTDFIIRIIKKITQKTRIDMIMISEDMAYKAHSMISPQMTRDFLSPAYRKWIKEAKRAGCVITGIDSDGFVDELIPVWIESGINFCAPIEIAAGNDLLLYRKKYGDKMAYTGGLDKRVLALGGKEMKKEILRVVPQLIKNGGYIPGCDHAVPPDISWSNYVEYSRLLAQLSGWI